MSYKDGENVPGSHSPYTVWLKLRVMLSVWIIGN